MSETATDETTEAFDPNAPVSLQPRSEEDRAKDDRVVLFTMGDTEYSIPDRVRPNVSMQYLWMCRAVNVAAAEAWLAEELLGKEAYQALISFQDLTQEQSNEIFRRARAVVMGRPTPKASSSGGDQRSTAPARKRSKKPKKQAGSSTPRTPSTQTSEDSTEST